MTPSEAELIEKILDDDLDEDDRLRLRQAILRERVTSECLSAVREHNAFLAEQLVERQRRFKLLEDRFSGPAVAAARDVIRQEST